MNQRNKFFFILLSLVSLLGCCFLALSRVQSSEQQNISELDLDRESFESWCEQYNQLQPETQHTLDVLMLKARILKGRDMDNCQEAASFLTSTSRLSIPKSKIEDLSPLQSLNHIRTLDLGNNRIKDIQVLAKLTQLRSLDLDNNSIEDIEAIKDLTNLVSLSLNKNPIDNLEPITNLTKMKYLEMLDISLGNEDWYLFERMSELRKLKLSGTYISDLNPLTLHPHLNTLVIKNSNIKELSPLAQFKWLSIIDLSNNKIEDISPLMELSPRYLYLSKNQIRELPPSPLKERGINQSLQQLELCDNKIDDIQHISRFKNLDILYLCHNNISDISSLAQNQTISYLDLSYNPIDNIKSLSRLKNLSYINLSYTNTEDIRPLEILTRLKQSHNLDSWIYEINLSNTRVINLKPLSYFDRLDRLDLSHNTITDITPITNIEMLSLNLANNQLNTLQQLENLTVALVLDLRNNPINLKECPILPNTSGTSLFKISHLGDFQCYFD